MVSNKVSLERADHRIPTITGLAASSEVGVISILASTVIGSGVSATGSVGIEIPTLTKILAIDAITGSTGTLGKQITFTETGVVASTAVGTVTVSAGAPAGDVDIDFTQPTLDSRITCTRASDKWAWNSLGVLTNYGVNSLPLDHNPANGNAPIGRRKEKAATNLVFPSNTFTGYTKGASTTITGSFAIGPDGNAGTATRMLMTGTSGTFIEIPFSAVNGTVYTASVFIKDNSGSSSNIQFGFHTAPGSAVAESGASTIDAASNWRRFSTTWTSTVTGTAYVGIDDAAGGTIDILIFGLQCEANAVASSYIPTTSGTGTRAADFITFNNVSFLLEATGTLVLEFDLETTPTETFPHIINFQNATDTNNIRMYWDQSINKVFGKVTSNNVITVDQSIG